MRHIKLFENAGTRYIAILHQAGEGCDYTIGCGLNVIELQSSNQMDAINELTRMIEGDEDNGSYTGERQLENVDLYEISREIEFNVEDVYNELNQHVEEERISDEETREKEEYQRLHQKYGHS